MTASRRNALVLRWAILSASLTALFWGSWYLIAGYVPVVTEVQLTEKEVLALPFGVSRWWDILFAPLWTSAIIVVLSMPWRGWSDDDDLAFGLVFGLVFGLAFGLVFGLAAGLVYGLVAGLVAGLAFGLAFGLVAGLAFGLAFGLVAGLAFGLVAGLAAGLVYGLAYCLVIPTAGIIGAGTRAVCFLDFWNAVGRFLTAQDKKV